MSVGNQFDLHIMTVTGLQSPKILRKNRGMMLNLIGDDVNKVNLLIKKPQFQKFMKKKSYLYGKNKIKVGRKMGHINFYDSH